MSTTNSLQDYIILEEHATERVEKEKGKDSNANIRAPNDQRPLTITIRSKNTLLAKLLSFIVPGLGLIYLNDVGLGLRYFLTVVFMYTAHIFLGGFNVTPAYESHAVSFFFLMGSIIVWAASIIQTSARCERYEKIVRKIKNHLQLEHGMVVKN